jgi:hypothetical protein
MILLGCVSCAMFLIGLCDRVENYDEIVII